jgi:dTDP-4-dehydrorhamnose 3,5-epimerase
VPGKQSCRRGRSRGSAIPPPSTVLSWMHSTLTVPGSLLQVSTGTGEEASSNGSAAPSSSQTSGTASKLPRPTARCPGAGSSGAFTFADVPPGQAKYVTCAAGAILDVVVDLRVDSPGFGRWAAVQLDDETRRALYIAEGLSHAFVAPSDQASVLYLCSTPYAPTREHGVHPLDPAIGITGPRTWRRSFPTRTRPLPHWRKRDRPGYSPITAIAWPTSQTCVGPTRGRARVTQATEPATPVTKSLSLQSRNGNRPDRSVPGARHSLLIP